MIDSIADDLVVLHGVVKRFPGVTALDRIDLKIRRGETHVLLGENGAGKSTLVNLLSGIYALDEGTIQFDGVEFHPGSPREAMLAGVRMIHQELNLLGYLSIAENLFLDDLPNRFGLIDYKALNNRAQALIEQIGLELSPSTSLDRLSVAQMQMVEIAKALSGDSKLLIMDEPTAALSAKEIERLFEIIGRLKARGVTIIYISHRLQEIHQIGDRFTVLRNGQWVVTHALEGVSTEEIIRAMVGHELAATFPFRTDVAPGEEMLRVERLRPRGASTDVSFSVHACEILGIAGLVGSGRTEVLRAIFGAEPRASGQLWLEGSEVQVGHPAEAVKLGISLLTENRKEEGLLLPMNCSVNISLANLEAVSSRGLLNKGEERSGSERLVSELAIKTPSIDQLVRNLSGGNQQKIVLAKWLFRDARLVMVDEPTRGIDVGARREIHQLLADLAAAGKAILVVSSDLPELMGICHRILVFSNSRIAGELGREDFDQERILALAYSEYVNSREEAA